MSTRGSTGSGDWWTRLRTTAFFAAAAQAEPEPTAVDPAEVELADWAERRAELGLGGYDSDFVGIDDGGGLPDWRRPQHYEEPEPTELQQYAAQRKKLGVKDASAVFGASQPQPRRNASPWQAVNQ